MNKVNFIEKLTKNQDPSAEIQKLLQKLPSDMGETAKSHGAMIRRRIIDSATSLFLALTTYVIMELSQRILSATFAGIIDITDQAWQKKLYAVRHGYPTFCPRQCLNFLQ